MVAPPCLPSESDSVQKDAFWPTAVPARFSTTMNEMLSGISGPYSGVSLPSMSIAEESPPPCLGSFRHYQPHPVSIETTFGNRVLGVDNQ